MAASYTGFTWHTRHTVRGGFGRTTSGTAALVGGAQRDKERWAMQDTEVACDQSYLDVAGVAHILKHLQCIPAAVVTVNGRQLQPGNCAAANKLMLLKHSGVAYNVG